MELTKAIVRKHKTALTKAKNSGDLYKVVTVCDAAFADFDKGTWPDNWHLWNIARQDALVAIQRGTA